MSSYTHRYYQSYSRNRSSCHWTCSSKVYLFSHQLITWCRLELRCSSCHILHYVLFRTHALRYDRNLVWKCSTLNSKGCFDASRSYTVFLPMLYRSYVDHHHVMTTLSMLCTKVSDRFSPYTHIRRFRPRNALQDRLQLLQYDARTCFSYLFICWSRLLRPFWTWYHYCKL